MGSEMCIRDRLNDIAIAGIALAPMGEGEYILPLKKALQQKLSIEPGDRITATVEVDDAPLQIDEDLMACLAEEPEALHYLRSLAPSHQRYFLNWVASAKTETTKTRRIAAVVDALSRQWDYSTMIRAAQKKRQQ